jgi:L-threonylcarbamoyladenylate synthase
MARYWPGALTLVLRAHADLPTRSLPARGRSASGLPGHPVARGLVSALGEPVTAPSANPHGEASPRPPMRWWRDSADRVDLVLDGGSTAGGPASTLLDLTRTPPVVLRVGAVVPVPRISRASALSPRRAAV